MTYVHGQSKAAQAAHHAEIVARQKAAKLTALNAELDARIKAREEQLKYFPKVRTYAPTPEQIAYREKHADIIAAQPAPIHGGPLGLRRAADEMEEHEKRKRQEQAA
jgi:hypothetical protein